MWRRDETKDPENGDAGTPKLMTHGCPRNAQLGTDLAQGPGPVVQGGCALKVHGTRNGAPAL